MKILKYLLLVLIFSSVSYSQFDKTILQVGIGIIEPFGTTAKGTYYANYNLGSTTVLGIDTNFMRNNYGLKTGLSFFGKAKFNFDKYAISRGVLFAGFNTFNTFEPSKSGNIGVTVININNQYDTVLTSVNYSYTFNSFSFGLGFELAPTAFTSKVSPYFGANIAFNLFNGKLSRTENRIDSLITSFSDFRIGVNFDAGIEFKINKQFGLALGVKYDLGNLLLKNTNSGIADAIEWGKTNGSLNDEEGRFYSTIYGPVLTATRREVLSARKDINWGTIYVAANIYLDKPKAAPKKK
ncbi:MAG: opacity family porin [Ignavibacteria bacterium]